MNNQPKRENTGTGVTDKASSPIIGGSTINSQEKGEGGGGGADGKEHGIIDHNNNNDDDDDDDDDDDRSQTKSDGTMDELDIQGISLLSEIFPEASREELEELHFQRVEAVTKLNNSTEENLHEADDNLNETDVGMNHDESIANDGANVYGKERAQNQKRVQRTSKNEASFDENDEFQSSHGDVILNQNKNLASTSASPLTSKLGRRILQQSDNPNSPQYRQLRSCLSDNFLRIPSHQLNQVGDRGGGTSELKDVSALEKKIIQTHQQHGTLNKKAISSSYIATAVFSRDMYVGLGLQLREWKGCVYANALTCRNGKKVTSKEMYQTVLFESQNSTLGSLGLGPAFNAGVKPGDRILGVDGKPFLGFRIDGNNKKKRMSSSEILSEAAKNIAEACDPIALHIMRVRVEVDERVEQTFSKNSNNNSSKSEKNPDSQAWEVVEERPSLTPRTAPLKLVHPIAFHMTNSGIIKIGNEIKVSEALALYTNRAIMWRENHYLNDIIVDERNLRQRRKDTYPGFRKVQSDYDSKCSFDNSSIVRQALCIHLVNTFIDGDRLAFTIWVYDVESRSEWYAPVR